MWGQKVGFVCGLGSYLPVVEERYCDDEYERVTAVD